MTKHAQRSSDKQRQSGWYEKQLNHVESVRKRQIECKWLVKHSERPLERNIQGYMQYYTDPLFTDTALGDWWVFVSTLESKSGKHRHQGALGIFVLEGKGYTVIDGERHDWEAGDLILIPLKPGGCEHQHFNLEKDKPSKWVAFIYDPYWRSVASELTQIEGLQVQQEG